MYGWNSGLVFGSSYALLLIRLKSVSTSHTSACLAQRSQVVLLSRPSHLSWVRVSLNLAWHDRYWIIRARSVYSKHQGTNLGLSASDTCYALCSLSMQTSCTCKIVEPIL